MANENLIWPFCQGTNILMVHSTERTPPRITCKGGCLFYRVFLVDHDVTPGNLSLILCPYSSLNQAAEISLESPAVEAEGAEVLIRLGLVEKCRVVADH